MKNVQENAVIIAHSASAWDSRSGILRTRLTGPTGPAEVVAWRASLYIAAARLPRGTHFKLLVDIRGYNVADVEPPVHQVQREVIPIFLANYHYRTGFLDFFGVKWDFGATKEDAYCVAVAHVHNECGKMDLYRQTLGREDEGFSCRLDEAEAWIKDVPSKLSGIEGAVFPNS